MAIELCSDNFCTGMSLSPRISFSHDFCPTDIVPIEQRRPSLDSASNIDFDFHVCESFDHDSSSADELFSGGKIRPVQIKRKDTKSKKIDQSKPTTPPLPQTPGGHQDDEANNTNENSKKLESNSSSDAYDQKQSSKSFWRFKRSSSLNCGSGYGRSFCPLPLLSRSNSTGSASSVKRASSMSKDGQYNHKQNSQKHSSSSSSFASVKTVQTTVQTSHQKPPLKKNYGSYGTGAHVHVNPVLYVPSAGLFGFGSIFSNGKDKNKKK